MALSFRRALALACAAPLIGFSAPAASQTLTLEAAIEQTLESNPELRVYTPRLTAARAQAAQAALKPPLELQTEVQDAFGTGRASGFDIAETTIALSQVVELGGKRGLRTGAAAPTTRLTEAGRATHADRARIVAALADAGLGDGTVAVADVIRRFARRP